MEVWLGLIGAIVGWVLNEATKTLRNRRQADSKLRIAAFVCLDRLVKIQDADSRSDAAQRDGEINYLGRDLDRYRDCIAASSTGKRAPHWAIYRRMIPVLLKHDLGQLDFIIAGLEKLSGAATEREMPKIRPS